MKQSLAAAAVLALAILLPGCGSGDDTGHVKGDAAGPNSASPTSGGVGEVENETYARGADVDDFCAVLGEIDAAIDESGAGGAAQWRRIVASFTALDATGVTDDLPEDAVTALTHLELLVQDSSAVAELDQALEQAPPDTSSIEAYAEEHCHP